MKTKYRDNMTQDEIEELMREVDEIEAAYKRNDDEEKKKMSTRSYITRKYDDGKVRRIYCHFDGYPQGVGRMLYEFYDDADKVDQLLALGDLSSLGPEIGDGSQDEYDCMAYTRGYKEPATFNSESDFLRQVEGIDYLYMYDEGVWKVRSGGAWVVLKDFFRRENDKQNEKFHSDTIITAIANLVDDEDDAFAQPEPTTHDKKVFVFRGEPPCDMSQFLRDNADDPDLCRKVLNMKAGDRITVGGGASVSCVIEVR